MAAAPHPAALIDTDVLIDAARGYLEASTFLGEQHQAFRIQTENLTRGQACDSAILERAIQPEIPFC